MKERCVHNVKKSNITGSCKIYIFLPLSYCLSSEANTVIIFCLSLFKRLRLS